MDDVLNKIFSGTPDNRVNEIKKILQESEIYSGTDVPLLETIKLRNEKSLSEPEILKIKQYIRESKMSFDVKYIFIICLFIYLLFICYL